MALRKTIFVTGGGSGIGRAIAVRFAREGWFVGLGDLDEAAMEGTEELMPGGFAYSHRFDVAVREQWDEALRIVARASGGRIDVVANSASMALAGPLAELATDEVDRALDVTLKGAIYGAQAAYSWLRQTAPGSCLVNTASAAALYGMPGLSVCAAGEAGLRGLTESLDAEWAADGIAVRSLLPAYAAAPRKHPLDGGPSSAMGDAAAEAVAEAAWQAVTDGKPQIHRLVGRAARRTAWMARWTPSALHRRARLLAEAR